MAQIEETGMGDVERAHKANRIAAIVMAFVTAAVLLLLRPELSLVYIAYVVMSVYYMSFARTYGIFIKPYPVSQQNFVAYVSISTVGFVATLYGAPEVIELLGSAIYLMLAALMAFLVLRGIMRSL